MIRRIRVLGLLVCTLYSLSIAVTGEAESISLYPRLKNLFADPPASFRSAPLWVWNDDVTEQQIDQQLLDLKAGGIGGVFIHPRPGLITPYLSDKWFALCRYTVEKSKELGMKTWLYDENSYPSGFAGGHVPAAMPESYNQGQGLVMHREGTLPSDAQKKYFILLKKTAGKFTDITNNAEKEKGAKGDYYLFEKSYYPKSPWFGGYSYVDILAKGVTEKFIETTMTGYQQAFGSEFGATVPGIFTDEPNINPPAGLKWTPDLFAEFQRRWGYDLLTNLPSLVEETNDWRRIRHDYHATLLDMTIERWSKPWYQYCEEHHLQWTGHYWEHGWPGLADGSDNMAMYAWHQMPAIDLLMNQYDEGVNGQFGNVRIVKELASVANQMERNRTLSETYGAAGWDLRFSDMKRIGDWEYVLGVNFLNQHLSYITLNGARKRDHPQSFSYHDPWWPYYHVPADYFARLSLALSAGKQINHILVLEPTTTAWLYHSHQNSHKKLANLGPVFQKFVLDLEKHQIEYDLGSENILQFHGRVVQDSFFVGRRAYDLVVLPPSLENLEGKTVALLRKYLAAGGKVLAMTDSLCFVDGRKTDEITALASQYAAQWHRAGSLEKSSLQDLLKSKAVRFNRPESIPGKVFHHRREMSDGQILFLVNSSADDWADGRLWAKGRSVEELDLVNGTTRSYPGIFQNGEMEITFDLPPTGSLLLYVHAAGSQTLAAFKPAAINLVPPQQDLVIKRNEANVLTLDYCDVEMAGKSKKDLYFFQAADTIFRQHGFDGNPWSSSVQFKSAILDRNHFAQNSGFMATFSFIMDPNVATGSLRAVIERPALWQVAVNGHAVAPLAAASWLDRANGVYDISALVEPGVNRITLIAAPMTVHSELEPIYILGDFMLASQAKGWKLIPDQPLALGGWRSQGLPFYSSGVSYSRSFLLDPGQKRTIVKLTDWLGGMAEVKVNGKYAGIIAWLPDELDISDFVRNGANTIMVTAYGTLKNLLGPHHIGSQRGSAWPASFQSAPDRQPAGKQYDGIEYGLFRDFVVLAYDGPRQNVYWRDYRAADPEITPADPYVLEATTVVSLASKTKDAKIRYTLDGRSPDQSSSLFTESITLAKSTTVKAKAFKQGMLESHVVERAFRFLDKSKNGLNYSYFEGTWDKVPDMRALPPQAKGRAHEFSLARLPIRDNRFALEFAGFLEIVQTGDYVFSAQSNDGSILELDQQVLINNDGQHGMQEKQGTKTLTAGLHAIRLRYFDSGGSRGLEVRYQGPGLELQSIPAERLFYRK